MPTRWQPICTLKVNSELSTNLIPGSAGTLRHFRWTIDWLVSILCSNCKICRFRLICATSDVGRETVISTTEYCPLSKAILIVNFSIFSTVRDQMDEQWSRAGPKGDYLGTSVYSGGASCGTRSIARQCAIAI